MIILHFPGLFIASLPFTSAYVDFGTATAPCAIRPLPTIPRPKFVPDDSFIRYEAFSSSIAAVAPSIQLGRNGTHQTSWSLHFVQSPTRTVSTHSRIRELRRRGVFSGDPPIATCRPCDSNGNPINDGSRSNSTNGVPICSVTNYEGVFRSGSLQTSSLPDYCFNAGYTGPLIPTPVPTDAGLPCCPVCYPAGSNNTSFTATTGVFSPPPVTFPTLPSQTTTPGGNGGGKITVTITATATEAVTSTRVTLSIETITPSGVLGSPVVTTAYNTIIGCGTASGCGTVVGSGTVFLAPFGFPAVTSSGTVSGCAPTVIGCGTMIATRGVFTAPADGPPATITACGEGTGSATLIGSGTVWPAGFMDMISFVSSGTVTGSGRVKGCGIITGRGTFTVSEPYTTTFTPREGLPTVNVYVSYCPPDQSNPLMRVAGTFGGGTGADTDAGMSVEVVDMDGNRIDPNDPLYNISALAPPGSENANRLRLSGMNLGNLTSAGLSSPFFTKSSPYNSTFNGTSTGNPLCHVCPQDSGICCPPFTDCGLDGHCPWTALEGCGYAMFGVNLVDVRNSSQNLGSGSLLDTGAGIGPMALARYRAPGLPGSRIEGGTEEDNGNGKGVSQIVRRGGMERERKIDHVRVHRIRVARVLRGRGKQGH